MAKRLEYLDFCKVLAIYLVTMAHCAQQLSGSKFPGLLLTKDSFISVNMAVFMLASGYVMNIEKMRQTNIKDFLISKAIRLLLPMTSWYLVLCVVSLQQPHLTIYWSIYWYLGAMFVCFSTIKILTLFISNNIIVSFVSVLLLSCIPMISFERSCYMIPFLWVGYFLRYNIDRIGKVAILVMLIIYMILYHFWDIRFSIYVSPFHIWDMDLHTVFSLFFRFIIGVVGGTLIISASRYLINRSGFGWMRHLAKFGPYTLVFYTMSFVLNAILVRIMWHINSYISTPGLLDIIAILVTIFMLLVMYYFQIYSKKNRWLSLIFLGER